MTLRPDEQAALDALEEAWGLKRVTEPRALRAPAKPVRSLGELSCSEDDGSYPPTFLLIPRTEREELNMHAARPWWQDLKWSDFVTVDEPWTTAAVCAASALVTAAVLLAVLGW